MRRLSIIDLSTGRQPISNEDGQVTIVFNGEVYNFQELQPALVAAGHQFSTHSDTEVIVHAYEEHGTACLDYLRGMFAIALWDARKRQLFLARDRVGKKPLYYTVTPKGTLVFASELKAILQHPEVTAKVDPSALDAFLTFGYVPDPLTIFRAVKKLPPAHYLTCVDGHVSLHRYWDFCFTEAPPRRADDYVDELKSHLQDAVRLRLVSDVPLGAFLSGGVDSSAVVGLMSRLVPGRVKTFSIGFREDSYSELKYARLAASHFATDHHEFIVTPEICDGIDTLVWHCDEPFADSSAIPTFAVSRLAREYVTVTLSGDGGDELFAGYTRYGIDQRRRPFAALPAWFRTHVLRRLSRRLPHAAWGRNYLFNVSQDDLGRYIDNVSVFSAMTKTALYSDGLRASVDPDASTGLFREIAGQAGVRDPLTRLLYLDSRTYLPGDILTKVDRMTMAASLEGRAPLLDHKLIEFVSTVPAELKMKGRESKFIFKEAIQDFVPAAILHRPKQGFGVPIQEWINRQLRARIYETLLEPRTLGRGYVNPRYVSTLLAEHERGRRDHSAQVWALFVLELWHRTFVDRTGSESQLPPPPSATRGVRHGR
jgi:asparagine synthase (glutamine-hydrolysing)